MLTVRKIARDISILNSASNLTPTRTEIQQLMIKLCNDWCEALLVVLDCAKPNLFKKLEGCKSSTELISTLASMPMIEFGVLSIHAELSLGGLAQVKLSSELEPTFKIYHRTLKSSSWLTMDTSLLKWTNGKLSGWS